ncbi:hypothetical protein [Moritella sp.]|uniref:hypothetical protein n=1 Tax=Moritella sp. TaxID=78556 RepID=UPI001DFB1096|nr:hypothetical protein [Moritella sp.]MCJ8350450.1 hypothetical protein [Moritella sp.]NQZ40144.1 hypothetical protein [Moritella sp.]
MFDDQLPIIDISKDGRQKYVEQYRRQIELVLLEAMDRLEESFSKNDQFIKVFGSHDSATDKIINLFLADSFDLEKAHAKNLSLFTQLDYWLEYKTGGRLGSNKMTCNDLSQINETEITTNQPDNHIENLAKGLSQLSLCVAPDLVGYWLMANKKLLDEIGTLEQFYLDHKEIENMGSDGKKTRYKADACFRYLYLFLNIRPKLFDNGYIDAYEAKYFVRGNNIPQYTSIQTEDHIKKMHVRKVIRQIIDRFEAIHSDSDTLQACLIRTMARKSLVDLYEFEPLHKREYGEKLKGLKQVKTACAEEFI